MSGQVAVVTGTLNCKCNSVDLFDYAQVNQIAHGLFSSWPHFCYEWESAHDGSFSACAPSSALNIRGKAYDDSFIAG